jgi:hypothetical protein
MAVRRPRSVLQGTTWHPMANVFPETSDASQSNSRTPTSSPRSEGWRIVTRQASMGAENDPVVAHAARI